MANVKVSDEEYKDLFVSKKDINENALKHALDIRKYEIDLYWRRTTYFWAFIAATLAGFIAINSSSSIAKTDLSVLLCCFGIVFSFGWHCVNRGSKYWQENWENHVDLLEDKINGPLYKVVLSRSSPTGVKEFINHMLTGPSPISVSKINQLISLYITLVWCGLLYHSLPVFNLKSNFNLFYSSLITMTLFLCIAFVTIARSHNGFFSHQGNKRSSNIRI